MINILFYCSQVFLWVTGMETLFRMSKQDVRDGLVDGDICYQLLVCSLLCLTVKAYLGLASIPSILCISAVSILYVSRLEIPCFGDADLTPVIATYTFLVQEDNLVYMLLWMVSLLLAMPIYTSWYRKNVDSNYTFGAMQYVPVLPLFLIAWFVVGIGYVILKVSGI